MTDKQKEAVRILNHLHSPLVLSEDEAINDDEYFMLLEFVIGYGSE